MSCQAKRYEEQADKDKEWKGDATLIKIVMDALSDKMALNKFNEMREQATKISGGRTSQVEEIVREKTLK